ncbi:MAG: hypothetical protein NUW00_04730 [Candidatus Kaiserbacteria bacterium]|nr:hypothetical protein [Candidatus Kaiserbacteria bacterium]
MTKASSGKRSSLQQRDIDINLNGYKGTVSVFFDIDGSTLDHRLDEAATAAVPLTMQWAMVAAGIALAQCADRMARAAQLIN